MLLAKPWYNHYYKYINKKILVVVFVCSGSEAVHSDRQSGFFCAQG